MGKKKLKQIAYNGQGFVPFYSTVKLKYKKMNNIQNSNSVVSAENGTKPNVSGSGFRIVELDGIFKIERKFRRITKKGYLWWSKKVEEYVWKDITTYGGECYRIPIYGTGVIIDTYKYKMPEFESLSEAEKALNKLINPPQPVYHYR